MLQGLDAQSIKQLHDRMLSEEEWQSNETEEARRNVWQWIETNHRYNILLWNEEDKARRVDVGPAEIAGSKRLIDRYNQKRNDAVEAIDEAILSALADYPADENARLNSETAGAMIDRLSILSLKIFHMREQTQRVDVDAGHIMKCEEKLHRLKAQREDLGACLDTLLAEAMQGRACFKVYRQFKMYNDPSLNPYLYGMQKQATAGGAAR